jgi:hypothetical protein
MTDAATIANAPQADERPAAELMREQRLQRNLKLLVGGLGALILVGVGAVVVRMVTFASVPRAPGATVAAVATPGGEIALELPQGAKIVSVSVSGNRLAVHHESPAGSGITVIDIDSGKRIADVKATPAVPRN